MPTTEGELQARLDVVPLRVSGGTDAAHSYFAQMTGKKKSFLKRNGNSDLTMLSR